MNLVRRVVFELIVGLTVVFAGCHGQSSYPEAGNTLELALKTAPNQLDPALAMDVAEGEICTLLFQGLVRFSPEGDIVPDLAGSWEVAVVEGGRFRYVFHIDTRMRFANGRRVESGDVVFSFERVLRPASRSSRCWVLARIRGAEAYTSGKSRTVAGLSAPDDSTVVVELTEPFNPFLSMLALPAAMVVPREVLRAAPGGIAHKPGDGGVSGFGTFEALPVGSGRWRLTSWERGDYLVLEPNPHHPNPPAGIAAIRFRIIPEAFTRVAEFESGTLDILEIPTPELARYLGDHGQDSRVQSRTELRVYYIGLNNSRPPFDDVRVRRALNMAVDVDQLIDVLAGGQAVRATGAVPPGLRGYEERPGYRYDLDGAKRLLAEAGYPDGFTMEIWQRGSPEGNRVLEAVQGYLSSIGVEVILVRREWSAFKEAVSAGRVDAFLLDWFADYPSAENFIYPLFHSQNAGSGGNRAFFADPEIDRLIEKTGRTIKDEESARAYARIDSLVYDAAPWIYLYFPKTFRAVSGDVSGYTLPTLYLGGDYAGVRKKTN